MTDRRANRLVTSFIGAGQLYEIAELLVPQEIPARWAARLADALGDEAGAVLRADPWRLLALPDAAVAQADRLARSIEPDVRRDDPRRGRALVEWTLARYARDGHTAAPQSLVADGLRPFGVDAQPALGARWTPAAWSGWPTRPGRTNPGSPERCWRGQTPLSPSATITCADRPRPARPSNRLEALAATNSNATTSASGGKRASANATEPG